MSTVKIGSNSLILREQGEQGQIFMDGPNQNLFIQTGPLNNHTIINGGEGNVGIGTASPQEKLHVNGNAQVNGNITLDGDLLLTTPLEKIDPCANFTMVVINDAGKLSAVKEVNDTAICDPLTYYYKPYWALGGNLVGTDGKWIGTVDNYDFTIRTNSTPKMVVKKSGEVGIGTNQWNLQAGVGLQVGGSRSIHMGQANISSVYGEYIGFNGYLNSQNELVKSASANAPQMGAAVISTDYNGNLRIQTFNSGNATTQASTPVNPQFLFSNEGDFQITRQSNNKIIFKVDASDEKVFARGLKLTQNSFPDYVFAPGYYLSPLSEVELFIRENGRLKGMPSADEVCEEGLDLAEINRLLVEKVEELTLYLIELNKRVEKLEK